MTDQEQINAEHIAIQESQTLINKSTIRKFDYVIKLLDASDKMNRELSDRVHKLEARVEQLMNRTQVNR